MPYTCRKCGEPIRTWSNQWHLPIHTECLSGEESPRSGARVAISRKTGRAHVKAATNANVLRERENRYAVNRRYSSSG